MSIVPVDKRKEIIKHTELPQLSIFTKRGIKQKDLIDGRVSIRRLKTNRAINQDIKDFKDKISYLQESIIDLQSTIRQKDMQINAFETLFQKNTKRINEVKILEDFRDMFILKCMIKSGTPITIFQCTGILTRKECKYAPECKDRIKLLRTIF